VEHSYDDFKPAQIDFAVNLPAILGQEDAATSNEDEMSCMALGHPPITNPKCRATEIRTKPDPDGVLEMEDGG
jgi:hypothetical protein